MDKIARELTAMARSLIADRSGEKLPMKFIVTKNKISVSTPSTSFVNRERKQFSDDDIEEAMGKMKEIRKLAREKGVTLRNYSKRLSELKNLNSDYHSDAKKYNKKFDELYMLWRRIEKQEDMFYIPLSDLDERIPEFKRAGEVADELNQMFYRSTTLSQVSSLNYRLDDVLMKLNRSNADNYTMMAI
jgi:hypothetical protein